MWTYTAPRAKTTCMKSQTHPMRGLIGFSGFVGQHLLEQVNFEKIYRSTTISKIEGEHFDLLICAGVPAVKWIANKEPATDRECLENLLTHLKTVRARNFVLISTIDVYPDPTLSEDESAELHGRDNHAYGKNRLWFEDEAQKIFSRCTIVRLPALFGKYMKKNYIFDLLHNRTEFIENIQLDSMFQWYNTERLWGDIQTAMDSGFRIVNLFTEPLTTGSIIRKLFPQHAGLCIAETPKPIKYNLKTRHAVLWGGATDYISRKEEVLHELEVFITGYKPAVCMARLCISNIAWDSHENDVVLELLRFKGVKNLEIAPTKVLESWDSVDDPLASKSIRDTYKDFKFVSFQSILFNTVGLELFGNPHARESLMQHCKKVVNLAASLDVKVIVWGSPKQRLTHGQSYESCFKIAVSFFKHLGDYAHQNDVVIAYEANAQQYGCDFCFNAAQAAALVRATDSPGLKLNLDTANMYLAGDQMSRTIETCAEITSHVQTSEPYLGNFKSPAISHESISQALVDTRYTGYISIEMRRDNEPLLAVSQALAQITRSYNSFLSQYL